LVVSQTEITDCKYKYQHFLFKEDRNFPSTVFTVLGYKKTIGSKLEILFVHKFYPISIKLKLSWHHLNLMERTRFWFLSTVYF
jgi:hypothetical protein